MKIAPLPLNEKKRLAALAKYRLLDTPAEQIFDDIAWLAATICDVPIALISLIDQHRQWFKSNVGLQELTEIPRDLAFCSHAILNTTLMEVSDTTKDERFYNHPTVISSPKIHFYAAMPLITPKGYAIGTLAIADRIAKKLNDQQKIILAHLSKTIITLFQARKKNIKLRETLHRQSIHDSLTGLYNRRYLDETLHREIYRTARQKTSLIVVMIDIDHFKEFNDTYGHDTGDAVLRQLATIISSHTRTYDLAYRFGGEEFLLLLHDMPIESVIERAEQLRIAVNELVLTYDGHNIGPITISQGIALFQKDGNTAEELIAAADKALYQAKQNGRNRIVIYGEK